MVSFTVETLRENFFLFLLNFPKIVALRITQVDKSEAFVTHLVDIVITTDNVLKITLHIILVEDSM